MAGFNTKIKFLHINVNGIKSKQELIQQELDTCNIDLASINETKLAEDKHVHFKGYTIIRQDRNAHGGGVAIIYNNGMKVTRDSLPVEIGSQEVIKVNWKVNNINIKIISIYNAPDKRAPIETIDNLIKNEKYIILMGDLNCNHTKLGSTIDTEKGAVLYEAIQTMNLLNLEFETQTRTSYIANQNDTTPDLVLISPRLHKLIKDVEVMGDLSSDHIPIKFSLVLNAKITKDISDYEKGKFLDYRKADWNKYKQKVIEEINVNHNREILTIEDLELR